MPVLLNYHVYNDSHVQIKKGNNFCIYIRKGMKRSNTWSLWLQLCKSVSKNNYFIQVILKINWAYQVINTPRNRHAKTCDSLQS